MPDELLKVGRITIHLITGCTPVGLTLGPPIATREVMGVVDEESGEIAVDDTPERAIQSRGDRREDYRNTYDADGNVIATKGCLAAKFSFVDSIVEYYEDEYVEDVIPLSWDMGVT